MDKQMTIDIGIDAAKREEIAKCLSRVLADTHTLYLKTHNFHWNVTGPMFQALHLMFETQYNELALAVDSVAERIRALGFPAPGTYKQFLQLSSIKDDDGMPKVQDMIRLLVEAHENGGAHRSEGVQGRGERERPADVQPAHPAHAGTREDGVDAAKPARIGPS
jgi:starvation-inducible DNA-binding protein